MPLSLFILIVVAAAIAGSVIGTLAVLGWFLVVFHKMHHSRHR